MSLSDITGRYSRQSSAKRRTFEVRLLVSQLCKVRKIGASVGFPVVPLR